MKRKYSEIKLKSKPQGEVSIPVPQITGNNVISFDTLSGFFSGGGTSGGEPIVVTNPTPSNTPIIPGVSEITDPSNVISNNPSVANDPPPGDPAQVNLVDQSNALIGKATNPAPTPKIDIEHDPLPSEVKQAEDYIEGQAKLPMGITPIDNESFMSNITYLDIGNYDPREVYKAEKSKDKKEGGGKVKNMIDAYLTMKDLSGKDLVDYARNTYTAIDTVSKAKQLYDIGDKAINHINHVDYRRALSYADNAATVAHQLGKVDAKSRLMPHMRNAQQLYQQETNNLFKEFASKMGDIPNASKNYDNLYLSTRAAQSKEVFKDLADFNNRVPQLATKLDRGYYNDFGRTARKITLESANEMYGPEMARNLSRSLKKDPSLAFANAEFYGQIAGDDLRLASGLTRMEPKNWPTIVANNPEIGHVYNKFAVNQSNLALNETSWNNLLAEQMVLNKTDDAVLHAYHNRLGEQFSSLTAEQISTIKLAGRIENQLKGIPVLSSAIAASPGTIGGITAQLVKAAPEFIVPIIAMKAIEKSADVANMTYMKMRTDGMKIDDDILNSGVLSDFFDLAGNALSIANPEKLIPGIAKSAYSIAYPQMKQMTKDYQNKMTPEGFLSKNWNNFKDPDQFWKLVSHNFYEDKNFVDQLRVAYDKLQLPPQKPKVSENEAPLASQFIENYIYNIYHHGKYLIKSGWESLTWKNIGDGIKGAAKWFLHRLNPLTMPKEAAQIAKFVLYDSPKFQIKGAYKTAKYFMGNTGEWKKQLREVFGNAKSYSNPEKINKLYEQYTGEAKDKESIADLYGRYVGAMIDPSLVGKAMERAKQFFTPTPVPEPAPLDPATKAEYIDSREKTKEERFVWGGSTLAENRDIQYHVEEAGKLFMEAPEPWQNRVLTWLEKLNKLKENEDKTEYYKTVKDAPPGYFDLIERAKKRASTKKLS